MTDRNHVDVIIIGAGIAGLAAARRLAEAGLSVAVIEARDRIGGRILTMQLEGCGLPVELGAEFVHGKPPELDGLIEEAGLYCFELQGTNRCFEHGQLTECSHEEAFQVLEQLGPGVDLTFAEFLATRKLAPADRDQALRYVEGFNAADANRIGTAALAKQQLAEDAIGGDRAFRIEQGYDRVPAFLLERFIAAGGRMFLSHCAEDISWRRGAVAARMRHLPNGEPALFEGSRAIISVPLGVLQARAISIQPDPANILHASDQMAMGTAMRITLRFREPFWAERHPDVRFVFATETLFPTWWTTSPRRTGMLTGWIGGPRTGQITALAPKQIVSQSLSALAVMFSIRAVRLREQLLSWHMHDWQSDPYSLGAYSYAPKGAVNASSEMTAPVEDTLFFAGEHTDVTGHWGTVHGALRSGLRAAEQVLSTAV